MSKNHIEEVAKIFGIERMPGDKITTKKQADVDLRIGALF